MTGLASVTAGYVIAQIRGVLGAANQYNISNDQLLIDLNTVWQYFIPQESTNFALKATWDFMTNVGVDRYIFPQGNILNLVDEPILDNMPLVFYDNNKTFFLSRLAAQQNAIYATGDGTNTVYTLALGAKIARGYADVLGVKHPAVTVTGINSSGLNEVLYDWGTGVLTDSAGVGSGTVNYITGAVTTNFANPVVGPIYANFDNSSWTRPSAALFFNNVLTLRNIPDKPYKVVTTVQYIPAAFASVDDVVPITNYVNYLIYKTAWLIAYKNQDQVTVANIEPLVREVKAGMDNITYRQSNNKRRSNQFFDPPAQGLNYPYLYNPYPPSV